MMEKRDLSLFFLTTYDRIFSPFTKKKHPEQRQADKKREKKRKTMPLAKPVSVEDYEQEVRFIGRLQNAIRNSGFFEKIVPLEAYASYRGIEPSRIRRFLAIGFASGFEIHGITFVVASPLLEEIIHQENKGLNVDSMLIDPIDKKSRKRRVDYLRKNMKWSENKDKRAIIKKGRMT